MRASRTYTLRLSDEGITLFLECHNRIARLLREFIPYGLTLSVAVTILERQEPSDIAAELMGPRLKACLGSHIRYVGSSTATARTVADISDRLVEQNEFAAPLKVIGLHLVALLFLVAAEDEEIFRAYRRFVTMKGNPGIKS